MTTSGEARDKLRKLRQTRRERCVDKVMAEFREQRDAIMSKMGQLEGALAAIRAAYAAPDRPSQEND